ncbi:hypothetical protein GCM10016455_26750 [Aliiroseovarius zhejiangensis]|uniref:Uncharacterized protein n=1 Tax=Aliiroseovarius zhejiangensis TaxID=1632025 RepID=A0ABQ3JAK1_9RHOB|nr:hypothetical protein [Aliiroseovarius zhejiangensis]GHF04062.1 hypothetical protein GCM10016455_26750 [Aliiroseovarius zhejiangensis]
MAKTPGKRRDRKPGRTPGKIEPGKPGVVRPPKAPRPELSEPYLDDLETLVGHGALREAIDRLLERAPGKEPGKDQEQKPGKDIDEMCDKLFATLRKRCPHLVPDAPVDTGKLGPQIDLAPKTVATLVRGAAVKLAGAGQTVWVLGDSEMLVIARRVSLVTEPGRILVRIPVKTDQTNDALIVVPFAVGSEKRPAGLMATTPMRPIGPEAIVEIWADALIAFAWGAVLTLTEVLASRAGQDTDRRGLIAFNLRAGAEGLSIGTMARHGFDRRAP